MGCDGVPFSGVVLDHCGVCGGDDLSCVNQFCYVDSSTTGVLRYPTLLSAIIACRAHVGVRIIDSNVFLPLPRSDIFSHPSGFILEGYGHVRNIKVDDWKMDVLNGTARLSNLTLTSRIAVPGVSSSLVSLSVCGCAQVKDMFVNAVYLSSTTALSVCSECQNILNPCTTVTVQRVIVRNAFFGTTGIGVISNKNTVIDEVDCTNTDQCVSVTTERTLSINKLVALLCGATSLSSLNPCASFTGIGPNAELVFANRIEAQSNSITPHSVRPMFVFSGLELSDSVITNMVISRQATSDTGVVIERVPSIETVSSDTEAVSEFIRKIWLLNRGISPFFSPANDIVYVDSSNTRTVCNNGCAKKASLSFFSDIAFTVPSTSFVNPAHVHMRVSSVLPSRFALKIMRITACKTNSVVSGPVPFSEETPSTTGCYTPSVHPQQRFVLFDNLANPPPGVSPTYPGLVYLTSPGPHQFDFVFQSNSLLALTPNVFIDVAYHVIDTVDGRVFSFNDHTVPLNLATTHNPSAVLETVLTVTCPVHQSVPQMTTFNPILCGTSTLAAPTPNGPSGYNHPVQVSVTHNYAHSYTLYFAVFVAISAICACIAMFLVSRCKRRLKKRKESKEDIENRRLLAANAPQVTVQEYVRQKFKNRTG